MKIIFNLDSPLLHSDDTQNITSDKTGDTQKYFSLGLQLLLVY